MAEQDEATRERAVQLYLTNEGMSVADIATQVGASRTSVYSWLQSAGVSGQRRRPRSVPDIERFADQVADMQVATSERLTALLAHVEAIRAKQAEMRETQEEWLVARQRVYSELAEIRRTQDQHSQSFVTMRESQAEFRVVIDEFRAGVITITSSLTEILGLTNRVVGYWESATRLWQEQREHNERQRPDIR